MGARGRKNVREVELRAPSDPGGGAGGGGGYVAVVGTDGCGGC